VASKLARRRTAASAERTPNSRVKRESNLMDEREKAGCGSCFPLTPTLSQRERE
jgi:hypothetical protein